MSAAYRVAPHVGLVREIEGPHEIVHLASLRSGPIITLPGTAALILLAALDPAVEDVSDEVARTTGADVSAVHTDVTRHLDTLVERGLIEAIA